MHVFILGGTGSIGTAVIRELRLRSHDVLALSRSENADQKLRDLEATPVRSDLHRPEEWMPAAVECDAIIQVAATFGDDMAEVDGKIVEHLIKASASRSAPVRILYTGGCWLYGETKDEIATEDRPFDPICAFSWMVEHGKILLAAENISCAIIHPAMVYHEGGGVFERFMQSAKAGGPIEIWACPNTRWPIIERSDLARAYCDLLERPDLFGHFNAVAETGVRVCDIANWICEKLSRPADITIRPLEDIIQEHGAWAKGPTLDQQMSAAKLMAATRWKPKICDFRQTDLDFH